MIARSRNAPLAGKVVRRAYGHLDFGGAGYPDKIALRRATGPINVPGDWRPLNKGVGAVREPPLLVA